MANLKLFNKYEEIYNLVSLGHSLVKYRYVKSKKYWRPLHQFKDKGGPIKSGKGVLYIKDDKLFCNGKEERITSGWGYMILLGRKSRLMVLDFDIRDNGPSLNELMGEVKENLGWLGKSSYVRTPSGGIHLYYKIPHFYHPQSTLIDPYSTFKARAPETMLAKEHVDVRVGHNCVIPLPGIEKNNIPYVWENGYLTDVLEMPVEIAKKFCNPYEFENYDHINNSGDVSLLSDSQFNGLIRAITSSAQGSRHNTLNAFSYLMGRHVAGGRLDEYSAYSALVDAGLSTGLGRFEVENTVKRALKDSKKEPIYE